MMCRESSGGTFQEAKSNGFHAVVSEGRDKRNLPNRMRAGALQFFLVPAPLDHYPPVHGEKASLRERERVVLATCGRTRQRRRKL